MITKIHVAYVMHVLQIRADVFLLESGDRGETAIHADVRSTSGILQLAVQIRLVRRLAGRLQPFFFVAAFNYHCAPSEQSFAI